MQGQSFDLHLCVKLISTEKSLAITACTWVTNKPVNYRIDKLRDDLEWPGW